MGNTSSSLINSNSTTASPSSSQLFDQLRNQARQQLALKQYTSAVATLSQAIPPASSSSSPNSISIALALLERAHCYNLVRARQEAIQDFTRAIELSNTTIINLASQDTLPMLAVKIVAYLERGNILFRQRRVTLSLVDLAMALQLSMKNTSPDSAPNLRGDFHNYRDDLWPYLSTILPDSTKSSVPISSFADFVGYLLFSCGDSNLVAEYFERAIENYNAALEIMFTQPHSDPAHTETHRRVLKNLVTAYSHMHHYESAIATSDRLLALCPNNDHMVAPRVQRADIFLENRQFAAAAAEFTQLIQTDPDHAADHHVRRAQVLYTQREDADVIAQPMLDTKILDDIEHAITLGTTDATAYWMRANIRRKAGMCFDAEEDYLRAIELEVRPVEKAKMHVFLADMYLEMDGHELEAQEHYGIAITLDHDNRDAHSGYANVIQQFQASV